MSPSDGDDRYFLIAVICIPILVAIIFGKTCVGIIVICCLCRKRSRCRKFNDSPIPNSGPVNPIAINSPEELSKTI